MSASGQILQDVSGVYHFLGGRNLIWVCRLEGWEAGCSSPLKTVPLSHLHHTQLGTRKGVCPRGALDVSCVCLDLARTRMANSPQVAAWLGRGCHS
jgi:hypothetical protein